MREGEGEVGGRGGGARESVVCVRSWAPSIAYAPEAVSRLLVRVARHCSDKGLPPLLALGEKLHCTQVTVGSDATYFILPWVRGRAQVLVLEGPAYNGRHHIL
jgi:hypothetical protein